MAKAKTPGRGGAASAASELSGDELHDPVTFVRKVLRERPYSKQVDAFNQREAQQHIGMCMPVHPKRPVRTAQVAILLAGTKPG